MSNGQLIFAICASVLYFIVACFGICLFIQIDNAKYIDNCVINASEKTKTMAVYYGLPLEKYCEGLASGKI